MLCQVGNFTGVCEVGIALNLSYSLFNSVREYGKHQVDRKIKRALEKWRLGAGEELPTYEVKLTEDLVQKKIKGLVIRSHVPTKHLVTVTAGAAICSGFFLVIVTLFGQYSFNLSLNSIAVISPIFFISLVPMPVALCIMKVFWEKGLKDIMTLLENHIELREAGVRAVQKVEEMTS